MTDRKKRVRLYVADPTVVVMSVFGLGGLGLAIRHGEAVTLGLMAGGWALYLVQEHLVHRFVFHAPAPHNQWMFDALYRLHYGHHDQVENKHLLFTPLWFAWPLAVINVLGVWLLVPLEEALVTVLGGGVPAYLLFEWLHLNSHFRSAAKGPVGRYITRRHGKHHCVDHGNWYTVSPGGQVVDQALGANPVACRVVANVRTCGLAPDDARLVRSRRRFGADQSLANRVAPLSQTPLELAG